jgi:pimeloyl-ACP methyl ester carboxylesterase
MPDVPTPTLAWSSCGVGLDCATLDVPYDYFHPSVGTFHLKVTRHKANLSSKRLGVLLTNPGGPGFGGAYLAEQAADVFSAAIVDRYDVVAWDPRGTGTSTPAIDCITDYDRYFALDPVPADAAAQQHLVDVSKEFDAACNAVSGPILPYVSTQDSARDMEMLRRALGESKVTYLGFSYGSELGAAWATMFPTTVKAAVLDGAADPTADAMQGTIDQAKGFEIALDAFLADCRSKCTFPKSKDPGASFDSLMKDIDAHQYPTEPGRPALNLGITYTAVVDALYSQQLWPELDRALTSAASGDGSGLLRLYDDYFQRKADGTYGNELEAFLAISCLDDRGPDTVAGVDAYNAQLEAVAPRIGPSFEHSYACVFWPIPSVHKLAVTGKGAGPIVVIGTTNDPATPFESSQRMARALEGGIFVKVVGNGHTGYAQSECAQAIVDRFFIEGRPPAADQSCQ